MFRVLFSCILCALSCIFPSSDSSRMNKHPQFNCKHPRNVNVGGHTSCSLYFLLRRNLIFREWTFSRADKQCNYGKTIARLCWVSRWNYAYLTRRSEREFFYCSWDNAPVPKRKLASETKLDFDFSPSTGEKGVETRESESRRVSFLLFPRDAEYELHGTWRRVLRPRRNVASRHLATERYFSPWKQTFYVPGNLDLLIRYLRVDFSN